MVYYIATRVGFNVLSQYTMHMNSTRYPEPEKFNVSAFEPMDDLVVLNSTKKPDRYIDDHTSSAESANLADPYQRDHWMFGAG